MVGSGSTRSACALRMRRSPAPQQTRPGGSCISAPSPLIEVIGNKQRKYESRPSQPVDRGPLEASRGDGTFGGVAWEVVVAVSEPDGLKIGRFGIDGGSTSLAFLSPRLVLSNKRRLSVASGSAGKNGGRPGGPIPARAVVGRRSDRTLYRSRKTLRGVLSRHTLIDNKGRAAASTNFSRPRARIQRSFFEHALRAACIRYKLYVFATTAVRRAGRTPMQEVRGVPRTAGTPTISRCV